MEIKGRNERDAHHLHGVIHNESTTTLPPFIQIDASQTIRGKTMAAKLIYSSLAQTKRPTKSG